MPLTSVAEIERKINKHLRRWLGVPPSFTAIGLYTKAGQMQLPLSSVEEEYKVAKCRTVMLYRDSHDQKVIKRCRSHNQGRSEGRYRWRHDKVLTVLACSLEEARKRKRQGSTRPGSTIAFVREGERRTITGKSREVGNILEKAKTWELRVDLGRKLQSPKVVQTKLRPDAVLWAEAEKKLVLVELTVPWEERCEEAYERKKNKYQELIDECRSKGWQAWLFPVEVGCRGFPAQSVWKLFTAIGVKGKERKVAVRKLGEAAERSSCWLWSRREESCRKPGGEDVQ
ncbi:uncharacterized protein LOC144907199 [Branchiostoma floridae x Branchiostoma belcheri]